MENLLHHSLSVFFGFFAIMNPFVNTTVFVSLTSEMDKQSKIRMARQSIIITFCIVLAFSLLGKALFEFFSISLVALKVTGGVLVFLIGLHMLEGNSSSMHSSDNGQNNLAVSPLAVPMLAGPGTIATAMNFSAIGGWIAIATTVTIFSVLCVITYYCFVFGERITSFLSKDVMDIIKRLMGLILAILGTQMLIDGIYGAINHFHS